MTRIIDLSLPIDEDAAEPFPVAINRTGHEDGADRLGRKFIYKKTDPLRVKLANLLHYLTGRRKIGRESFPGRKFLSHETVSASVHCGTHMDAPYHFGPETEGEPARTIDAVPLEWCYGNGVVLDVTHLPPGAEITPADIDSALDSAGRGLMPGDIALIMTGADKRFGRAEYFTGYPGLGREGLMRLLDAGVKVVGTDAPGLDRPFGVMVEQYYKTGDNSCLWPAHICGRDREYVHIERLANLDSLPAPHGFTFACFPVSIKNVGASWARAVAIIDE